MNPSAVRILLVEDNPGDARLLRESLRDVESLACELTHVERLDDALQRLKTSAFDVLLLDLSLPDSQGTGTVTRIAAAAPHIPIVVLTGTDDEAIGTAAVRCGAQDYLVKGQADPRLLVRSLRYAIERQRSEEQLRAVSQRLSYHVDNSPLAVIEWCAEMRLIRWSGAAERLFGWRAEEVLGKHMDDFRWIYHDDKPQVAEVEIDLRSGANPRRFSANRNYRKDGSIVHCEWYNSSLLDASGKLVSILSLVLDVTERKQAEEALRQANTQLEQRVAARTHQLASVNADLRDQMDAYQRLEAEVARLVEDERVHMGMELHDNLCQQIAATGMLTSTLVKRLRDQNSPLADMAARLVASLTQAGDDAHALARGLLPVQVEADGLMVSLAGLAQRIADMQGVACAFECAAAVPVESNATATHLFRIAQEAINNAVKHGQARHIVVTLTQQDGMTLAVYDDGAGIPPEKQRTPGSGLRIMAYRARVIGAALSIEPAPAGGTLVRCALRKGPAPL